MHAGFHPTIDQRSSGDQNRQTLKKSVERNEFERLKYNPRNLPPQLNSINIELYVIDDEDFFHHCASWLFPTASLVVLTFHDHRLMNHPELETKRLSDMVHSVRAARKNSQNMNGKSLTLISAHGRSNHRHSLGDCGSFKLYLSVSVSVCLSILLYGYYGTDLDESLLKCWNFTFD